MLRGGGPFDELSLECVVWSFSRWAEEEISDFSGELWTERADNVLEFRLLTRRVAKRASTWANQTCGSAGQKGGSLILTAATVGEDTAAGSAGRSPSSP